MADTPTLLDQWISKAKNHPAIAVICFAVLVLAGVGSFTDSLKSIYEVIRPVVPTPPAPLPKPQPPALVSRVNFKESFELKERDTYIGEHEVMVRVLEIRDMSYMGKGLEADVGVSAHGQEAYFEAVTKGKIYDLSRSDCDRLKVVIKDIQIIIPNGMTWADLYKIGPGAEALIRRKVIGTVTGKCEE
ncbi:hypothetical protein [Pseudomonas leptonychotis]|uniref:hypothetical protein n=1 Tax=Pseudomonas leptonychotis TaxID=2448482 RepID=UPI0039F0D542